MQIIATVSSLKREQANPLRFGLSAFVIARPTDAEAQAELAYLAELIGQEDNSETQQGIDPNVVMFQAMAKYPAVGGNGGTSAGLVGSYDRVAERIVDFVKVGIETFMLQFQPYPSDMQRFSQEIMARVQAILSP